MLTKRIIPVLLLKDNRLVRTIKFDKIIDIGNPVSQAKIYNAQDADELMFLDITGKSDLPKILEKVSDECFMPLCVGGGIRTIEQASILFNSGADTIVLCTEAYRKASLIRDCADKFGSQAVVVCIDVKEDSTVVIDRGTVNTIYGVGAWSKYVEQKGAGEIILHFVERDGTMQGFNLNLIDRIANWVNIPVVAMGGCGTLKHMQEAFDAGASAVACSSIFAFSDQSPIKARSFLKNQGVEVRC